MNEPERQKSERQHFWQQAKHAKLYSDVPQTLRTADSPVFSAKEHQFLRPRFSTTGGYKNDTTAVDELDFPQVFIFYVLLKRLTCNIALKGTSPHQTCFVACAFVICTHVCG